MRIAATFALILLFPQLAQSAEWKQISSSDELLMQIDTASIVVLNDGSRKAWKEFIYQKPQKGNNGKRYTRLVMLSIYKCTERLSAPIQEVDFDHVVNGSVVNQVSTPQKLATFLDIVPGSFDSDALDFVCSYKATKK